MEITHNNLPEAIGQICHRLECIELLLVKRDSEPQKDKEEFLTLKQVCELTGYAPPTVYAFCGKKTIPHIKRGARLIFEREQILLWLREGKRKTEAEIEAEADSHLQKLKIKR